MYMGSFPASRIFVLLMAFLFPTNDCSSDFFFVLGLRLHHYNKTGLTDSPASGAGWHAASLYTLHMAEANLLLPVARVEHAQQDKEKRSESPRT